MATERVGDLGERGLLARLQAYCPPEVIGDDAAVLALDRLSLHSSEGQNRSLVVTTDTLVDGVHFSDATTSPEDAGWRAIAANLSDLAAMGATPLAVTVALGLEGDTPVAWVENFYEGMAACLNRYDTPLVGGDLARSPVVTVSIAAFGWVEAERAILRRNARPGDAIVVTGAHGASRAGLEILLNPERGEKLAKGDRDALLRAHQRPQPRLDVLPLLRELTQDRPRVGGMDSSDGLADAIAQICEASQVGARLDRGTFPVPAGLAEIADDETALDWISFGGEDFELVLCLPPETAESLVDGLGGEAAIVGTICTDRDIQLFDSRDRHFQMSLDGDRVFQHFS